MKIPFLKKRIPSRLISWLAAALLLVSLVPMYALSFFNHPCYDDFGFSIRTHAAVQNGGGFAGAVGAAVENTVSIRNTWEGTYTTSLISALQPAAFGEQYYWVATFVLLSFFLVALWAFLRESVQHLLGASRTALWLLFCCAAFVMIQFVPNVSEAFFWFNGGVAYTLMWSLMLLRLAVWLRLDRAAKPAGRIVWSLMLIALSVLLGGSKYSTLLFALLVDAALLIRAFGQKRAARWVDLLCTLLLAALLVFSAMAPGNGVRAATLSGGLSAPMAVAQSMFFGVSLLGHWFSLPVAALWAVAVWQTAGVLGRTSFRFRWPLAVTAVAVCLFCAQLTPTLFTGNYLGDGRTVNTYYYTYILMSTGLVLYWTGWLQHRFSDGVSLLECLGRPDDRSISVSMAALLAVVLVVGCVAYHPEGSPSYGPQNMASGSAVRSLASGEAAAYDEAMDSRDAEMNDPSVRQAVIRPVERIPAAFMDDIPLGEMADYVETLYAEYYGKVLVTIEKEAPHAAER